MMRRVCDSAWKAKALPTHCLEGLRRTSTMAAGVNQVSLRWVKRFTSCKGGHTVGRSTRLQPDGIRQKFNDGNFYENLSRIPNLLVTGPTPTPTPQFNGYQVSFSEVKRPNRRADHPPPFSAKVRGTAQLTLRAIMDCHTVDFTF